MFDIGFWEIGLIAVVALLVIGPDKLPGVARTTGMWVGRLRRFVTNVKADIDRELKQEELRKALEEDAGLDEIKSILNSDRYLIEEEETEPDYLVKAIPDDDASHADLAGPEPDEASHADLTEPDAASHADLAEPEPASHADLTDSAPQPDRRPADNENGSAARTPADHDPK